MTIPVLSRRHLFAGTSRSQRRTRFTPAPASTGSTSPTRLQSGCRVWQQCSVRDHQRLPAPSDSSNAIARQTRCHVKSHGRPTARRSPAGSFFGGFWTPALTPGLSLEFGRHPKPLPKADLRRRSLVSRFRRCQTAIGIASTGTRGTRSDLHPSRPKPSVTRFISH
jgi:hypothetical protein